jgi:hypothetical protein
MYISNKTRALALLSFLLGFSTPVQAWWTFWPYTEHEDLTDRAIDIAIQRWPEMTAEVEAYRDEIVQGSHDEDFGEDTLYGSSSDYSGYSLAVPGAWWPTAQLPLNALQWIRAWQNPYSWDLALLRHGSNLSQAYLTLGHVIHNLEDLFVPAHSHISPHGLGTSGLVENHSWPLYFDNFEQYCEVTANELNRSDPNRIPDARQSPETLMIQASLFATADQESLAYYPSHYFAPPDNPGGWGRYRPYPYQGYPCGQDRIDNNLANAWSLFIVPRCVEHTAALIRLFFELTHTALEETTVRSSRRPGPAPMIFRSALPIPAVSRAGAIRIADVRGRVVRSLTPSAGTNWDGTDQNGRDLPAGRYFVLFGAADPWPVSKID